MTDDAGKARASKDASDTAQVRKIQIALPSTGEDEWQATREPIMSGWLTQGPQVAAFQEEFAARHGVKHAIATTSCTTALHLALAAMGVGPGDEVIVPAFTWVATANVVLYCGATPVLVDVDRETFNLDPAALTDVITDRTKAIIAVHLFGLCADMDEIARVAEQAAGRVIPILEDAACASGASYKGKSAGSLGMAGAFSFHPRKSITTGEGGMLTTNDDALAEHANMLRNHGATVPEEVRHLGPKPHVMPDFNLLGFNYRMTDLQASVGRVQLTKLDTFIAERDRWADFYEQAFADIGWLHTPKSPGDGGRHAWQAYVCYVDEANAPMSRNQLMDHLQDRGVSTRPGTHALHLLGLYRGRLGCQPDDFPGARDCDHFTMAIPLHNRMTEADYHHVARCLAEVE